MQKDIGPYARLLLSTSAEDEWACWGWSGRVDPRGRPRITISGKDKLARRVMWEAHHGPIEGRLLVLHDGPDLLCVRPDHLFLGTYHDKTAATMRPLAERFWENVITHDDGCWEWRGSTASWGYGRLQRGRRAEGVDTAHRVSWELHNGPIPEGMGVLHRCDNPPCTRPDHLFLGTQSDNAHDMIRKGRQRFWGRKPS